VPNAAPGLKDGDPDVGPMEVVRSYPVNTLLSVNKIAKLLLISPNPALGKLWLAATCTASVKVAGPTPVTVTVAVPMVLTKTPLPICWTLAVSPVKVSVIRALVKAVPPREPVAVPCST